MKGSISYFQELAPKNFDSVWTKTRFATESWRRPLAVPRKSTEHHQQLNWNTMASLRAILDATAYNHACNRLQGSFKPDVDSMFWSQCTLTQCCRHSKSHDGWCIQITGKTFFDPKPPTFLKILNGFGSILGGDRVIEYGGIALLGGGSR